MMKKVRKWLPLGRLLTGKWHGGIPRVMETFWILKWVVIMWVYIRVDSHPGVYLRSSHFLHVNYTTGKNIKGCSLTLAGRQLILVWLNTLAPPPPPPLPAALLLSPSPCAVPLVVVILKEDGYSAFWAGLGLALTWGGGWGSGQLLSSALPGGKRDESRCKGSFDSERKELARTKSCV